MAAIMFQPQCVIMVEEALTVYKALADVQKWSATYCNFVP